MIVEFTGLPGTGKTTLLPVVKTFLGERGLKAMSCDEALRLSLKRTLLGHLLDSLPLGVSRNPAKLVAECLVISVSVVKFLLTNLSLFHYVMGFQLKRRRSLFHVAMVLRSFFRTAGYYHLFRKYLRAEEAVVMDEGFVHRVVNLYVSEAEVADPVMVENYLKLLPGIDLIIFVKAPLDTCLERILRRRLPKRLQRLTLGEITVALANMAGAIEIAAHHIARRGWSTIEIDNTRDLWASAANLNDCLMYCCGKSLVRSFGWRT